MKKIMTMIAAVALSVSAMAATNTAGFLIGVEAPGNVYIYDEMIFAENEAYSPEFENLKDADKLDNGSANIAFYGYVNSRKCGTIATNNLDGTLLTLETVGETDYDISFYNVTGSNTYYLIDLVSNESVQIAEGNTLELRGVAANSTLADRFMISKLPVVAVTSVTTNDYGWASFSYNQDLVPVDATAQTLYKGAINGEYLDLDDVDYVKAGEGVLVYGTPNTIYNFAAGSGSDDFTGNALKATATYTTSMQNVYVLKGNAFLEYVGTNALAANKAYIQLPSAGPNNAPKRITMRFNGTTAIDNVEAEAQAEKFVENGQIYIRRGNEVYNLQGQKVNF